MKLFTVIMGRLEIKVTDGFLFNQCIFPLKDNI
jgi:hypothetical protein